MWLSCSHLLANGNKFSIAMTDIIRSDELLTTAAFRGEAERVRQMLQHGAVSSARSELKTTALHWAVSMGHVDVAEVRAAATRPP